MLKLINKNIGISAHIDAGKTTLTERILFYSGVNHKIGEVHDGSATMDWLPQEQERGITINSACTTIFWKNNKINIIDTPGHVDFTIEVERSMRVIDSVCMIYCSVSGVQAQSETVWNQSVKYKIPKIVFINKMDRLGADYYKVFYDIKEKFLSNVLPLFIPYFNSDKFLGLIDLINFNVILWNEEDKGFSLSYDKIPSNLLNDCNYWRNYLLESIIIDEDFYINEYLNNNDLSLNDIIFLIKKKTLLCKVFPVLCGSALKNKGVQSLLDSIVNFMPSSNDFNFILGINKNNFLEKRTLKKSSFFSALAFKVVNDEFLGQLVFFRIYSGFKNTGDFIFNSIRKTKERISRILKIHANEKVDLNVMESGDIVGVSGLKNTYTGDTICDLNKYILLENIPVPDSVISQSIEVVNKKDYDKLFDVLLKIKKEDPSFYYNIGESNEILINGMGELHLEIIVDKIRRNYNIDLLVNKPSVAFKETIKNKVIDIEGKYIRQSGGRGNYGHVVIDLEPNIKGGGYLFINNIKSGVIPKEYIGYIEKSIKDTLISGPEGYEVIDIKIILKNGSYHEVDSNENAFKIAASIAVKEGLLKANPIILEPIMCVNIETPEIFTGIIINDISSRRGILLNILDYNNFKLLKSKIPLSELFGYSTLLRSLTKGRANYNMSLYEYTEIDKELYKKKI